MRNVLIGFIAIVIAGACAPAMKGPQNITEADIRAMLSKVDEVSKAEDVEGIMSFMADDVEISITARGPLGSTKKTMGREDYEREVRLGMSLAEDYEFRINIEGITIAPDGQSAVVELELYEVVEMFGVKATSFTEEVCVIQRRDGKLKFVKVSAESEIQMSPSPGAETSTIPEGI